MRITVRVRPRASRTAVGGCYGDPGSRVLVVAVTAPAVGGAATTAVLDALAAEFGLRAAAVTLVTGKTARTKVIDLDGDPEALTTRLDELLHR